MAHFNLTTQQPQIPYDYLRQSPGFRFSDLIIRQPKATGKTYTLPDADGLGLVVSPVGGKSWHFRYYWLGKQKRISLGGYPEVSLREARALRDDARALLAKGMNPHTDRKQKRHAARLVSANTFGAIFLL
ncbi:hypothetical protein M2404_003504 [Rheinheimera pacifica]|nr:hypothetical protein [Rheinheimera pacifica]